MTAIFKEKYVYYLIYRHSALTRAIKYIVLNAPTSEKTVLKNFSSILFLFSLVVAALYRSRSLSSITEKSMLWVWANVHSTVQNSFLIGSEGNSTTWLGLGQFRLTFVESKG